MESARIFVGGNAREGALFVLEKNGQVHKKNGQETIAKSNTNPKRERGIVLNSFPR